VRPRAGNRAGLLASSQCRERVNLHGTSQAVEKQHGSRNDREHEAILDDLSDPDPHSTDIVTSRASIVDERL
jgi:hypothetical protein